MNSFLSQTVSFLKKPENILFIGILLIATCLRLYMIKDYIIFLGDEGRDALTAYNILHGHLTLLGPTASVGGFFFGPLYFYLITPFLWIFNYDPVGPAIMVAIFGVATVGLVYVLGKTLYDKTTAIIASLLYATNAYTVLFSRSSWNPHLVPFFAILTALSLYKAVTQNKKWLFLVSGFFYGLTFELHYVSLFFAVGMVAFVFFTTQQKKIADISKTFLSRIFLWGIGFVGGILPILAFEVRHQFVNTRNILQFIFFSKETGSSVQLFPTIIDVFSRVFTRGVFGYPALDQLRHYSSSALFFWNWIPVGIGVLSIIVLVREWLKSRKTNTEDAKKKLLLLLWIGFGIGLFGFYKKNIYEYYFEIIFPVTTLLVAHLGSMLWMKKTVHRIILLILVGVTIFLNTTQYPFHYPPNEQISQAKVIADAVLKLADNKPYNFALITGGNSDHAYRYFLTLAGHPPMTIDNAAIDPERKTVTNQLIVVCESLPCAPLGYSLWEVAGFGRADIVTKIHMNVVDIYKLKHYTGPL